MPWSKIRAELEEPGSRAGETRRARRLPYAEAIHEAFAQSLALDPSVFLMGQGVDDPNGMFGATLGLRERFGPERVFDTPLAENAMVGIAIGAALGGLRPISCHNRPDFLLLAMDQIVNHAAKWGFMFGGASRVPLVLWACIGRGWGSAAQHSQALQGLFLHVPGLKLVMPSTCHDTKGLTLAAIADENPVLVLEHRHLFPYVGEVPEAMYTIPLGKAVVRRPGKDVTIAGVSQMIVEGFHAAEILAERGIDAEVIDLRTLKPLDEACLLDSVRKTGRLVVVDTGWTTGGVTAEIAAIAVEKAFDRLVAPVRRVACPDVPTPSSDVLEKAFYPGREEIVRAAEGLMAGSAAPKGGS